MTLILHRNLLIRLSSYFVSSFLKMFLFRLLSRLFLQISAKILKMYNKVFCEILFIYFFKLSECFAVCSTAAKKPHFSIRALK